MRYSEIMDRQRPASSRSKMSAIERAAQFSAFAALVGLDEQMDETARLVDKKIELSEDESEILNRKIQRLVQKLNEGEEKPKVKATYFVPDTLKDGGAYVTKLGEVKRIDEVFFKIVFTDQTEVNISDILELSMSQQSG